MKEDAADGADSDTQQVAATAALRSALCKLSWRILPLLGLLSTLNYLDRANLAYASREIGTCQGKLQLPPSGLSLWCSRCPFIAAACLRLSTTPLHSSRPAVSLNKDLGFSTRTYGLGTGLFFLSYALLQVPANMMLARVGGGRWLATICLAWGIVASCFAAIQSEASFLVLRFFLGVAESGAIPGMYYYVSLLFPPDRTAVPLTCILIGVAAAQVRCTMLHNVAFQ